MTMKYLLIALVAACLCAPVEAAEKKAAFDAEDAAVAVPSAEELAKMRKKAMAAKKPFYVKADKAKEIAQAGQWPVLVCLFPKQLPPNSPVVEFDKKVLAHKAVKEFIRDNLVVLKLYVDKDAKNQKQIDVKSWKPAERRILENFVVNDEVIARAKKQDKPEPKYTDMACYPVVTLLDPMMQKEIVRLGAYDKDGGLGVFLSQLNDLFATKNLTAVISPLVQKVIDNPDEPKKWK